MEWYYVVMIILGFLGVAGALVYLGMTGKLTKEQFNIIGYVTGGLADMIEQIAKATENKAIDVFATVLTAVKQSVLAAENAWYNSEITADERYGKCLENLEAMLAAAGIELTDAQRGIVDALIKAACEEIGHGAAAEKAYFDAVKAGEIGV